MDFPNRKLNRLHGYDYACPNYYFVTLCTYSKTDLFGSVGNGLDRSEITLSKYGEIAKCELINIPNHFDCVRVDKYVIMPNHLHAIMIIGCDGEAERSRPFPSLSTVVGLYKSGVTKRIHEMQPEMKVWQKSFYEHIIRNEQGYREIWQYIEENPRRLIENREEEH